MKMLKVHLANRKITFIIILIMSLTSCHANDNKDVTLLKVFFENYKKAHRKDSIFFKLNNYNGEIFKCYKSHLKLKKQPYGLGFPLNKIFLKKEYDNFYKQIVDSISSWNIDLIHFKDVYLQKKYLERENLMFLYVSKPVYTIDEKYALIYYRNEVEGVYFISSIEVYENKNNSWEKVSKISPY